MSDLEMKSERRKYWDLVLVLTFVIYHKILYDSLRRLLIINLIDILFSYTSKKCIWTQTSIALPPVHSLHYVHKFKTTSHFENTYLVSLRS